MFLCRTSGKNFTNEAREVLRPKMWVTENAFKITKFSQSVRRTSFAIIDLAAQRFVYHGAARGRFSHHL